MKSKKYLKIFAASITIIAILYFSWSFLYELAGNKYYTGLYEKRRVEKSKILPSTYYISSSGNDNQDGRTEATAWNSINPVNKLNLNPGDSILFKGNDIFHGSLILNENDLGTSEMPIVISSYDSGKASIIAGNENGIVINNTSGIIIKSMIITGSGYDKNKGTGIKITNDLPGDIKLPFIRVNDVIVSGFGFFGILIDGNHKKSGFKDVVIEQSNCFDNAEAGLYVYGYFSQTEDEYAHENVHIRYVSAYNNPGKTGKDIQNTGSGIVLSDVINGTIEHCIAYNNGWRCESTQGGPVGIWAWDSKNIVIEYNESYGNKTNGDFDGGGFDLDGGMQYSVIQFNYSHNNDGPGYLLAQFSYARDHKYNIVRYNISENDGLKNKYAAIHLWGEIQEVEIYNNTVYHSAPDSSKAYAVAFRQNEDPRIVSNFPKKIFFTNNIFVNAGTSPLISIPFQDSGFHFINNNYFTLNGAFLLEWGGTKINSLSDWRKIWGKEYVLSKETGFNYDPQFLNPGKGITVNNADSLPFLNAYTLKDSSGLINKGIFVKVKYNIPEIRNDYQKIKIPVGEFPEPGACEYLPVIF